MSRGVPGAVMLSAAILLTGCGEQTRGGARTAHELPPEDERVAITERAVAAIALDHLPDDTTRRAGMYFEERQVDRGFVGADLRYSGDGEYDGDAVQIRLGPTSEPIRCDVGQDGCERLETEVEGAELVLVWEAVTPEEDPGYVALGVEYETADEQVVISYSGPEITGDPREMDLPITVADLTAVVEDPWLRLRTSPGAVEAGNSLDRWSD